jgi:integrase
VRAGELLGLAWRHIDGDVIQVRRQRETTTGEIGPQKSLNGTRDIIIGPSLGKALKAHKLASAASGDDDPVFAGDYHGLAAAFKYAVKGAGIERRDGHRLSLHSLRHGYGSKLAAETGDPAFVAR